MQRILSGLLGPVFAKEMVEISRRRRYYWNRILYGGALFLALIVGWNVAHGWQFYYQWNPIQLAAQIANSLFIGLYCTQYAAVYLFVPIFVAGVIASEREEKTLDLLFTTHLRDREIVLGKLASRLMVVALLFLAAVPVFSLIGLFGGIDPKMVWRSLAETLLAMICAGSMAIYFSSTSRGQVAALIRTYWWLSVWLLLLPLGTLLGLELLSVKPFDPLAYLGYWQLFINPIAPMLTTIEPGIADEFERYLGFWFYPLCYVLPLTFSSLLLWRAVARLRESSTFSARVVEAVPWLRAIRHRMQSMAALAGRRRRRHADRILWLFQVRNPLWLRSRLAMVYDRDRHLLRIQYAGVPLVLFFFGLMFVDEDMRPEDVLFGLLVPVWLTLAFFVTIVSASSLVSDRRHGFFELLLVTDLEPREIIDGTLAAVWEHTRVLVFVACAITGVMVAAEVILWYDALASLAAAACFGVFLAMLGVSCALVAPNTMVSLAATIALPLLMCVGVPLLGSLEQMGSYLLWFWAFAMLLTGLAWISQSLSAFSIACLFIAVQLALVSLAVCWTIDYQDGSWAVAHTSPAIIVMVNVEQRNYGYRSSVPTAAATVCYCTALLIAFAWARWWTIRNFNKLVGRTLARPDDSRQIVIHRKASLRRTPDLENAVLPVQGGAAQEA